MASSLTTGAAGDLSGTVIVEGGGALPSGPTRMRVNTRAVNPQIAPRNVGAGAVDNGRVNDDGAFEFKGAIGQVRLSPAWHSDRLVPEERRCRRPRHRRCGCRDPPRADTVGDPVRVVELARRELRGA